MQRVVAINLNGNSYQLEEPAYDTLRAYLERAEAALSANPDKAEILRDLEQAIAEKCGAYLSAHKSVIAAAEMSRILEEMGPVAGASEEAEGAPRAEAAQSAPRKRLYRIREGAIISGVCSGLGAYFDIDATIIRVLFVLAAFFTSGAAILVYVVMMFVVPSAHTSEEWAAAHGVPFNAQEVIDRAKREYSEFTRPGGPPWRWRREARRAWRRAMRERWAPPAWGPPAATPPAGPVSYLGRVLAGLFLIVFSLVSAALIIAFIFAVISLATTGAVLGVLPPAGIPFWLAIVLLALIFAAVSAPIAALRDASHAAVTGAPRYYHHGGGGVFALLLLVVAGWLAYAYVPAAHDWMNESADIFRAWLQGLDLNF